MAKADTEFLDDFLAYLISRASHLMAEDFAPILKEENFERPHWRILASLTNYDKIAIGKLANRVLMKQPTLTKILDRMEENNLVKRTHSKEDRRSVKISITKKGRDKVAPLLRRAKEHEKDVLEGYSAEEEAVLKQALRTLIQKLK